MMRFVSIPGTLDTSRSTVDSVLISLIRDIMHTREAKLCTTLYGAFQEECARGRTTALLNLRMLLK